MPGAPGTRLRTPPSDARRRDRAARPARAPVRVNPDARPSSFATRAAQLRQRRGVCAGHCGRDRARAPPRATPNAAAASSAASADAALCSGVKRAAGAGLRLVGARLQLGRCRSRRRLSPGTRVRTAASAARARRTPAYTACSQFQPLAHRHDARPSRLVARCVTRSTVAVTGTARWAGRLRGALRSRSPSSPAKPLTFGQRQQVERGHRRASRPNSAFAARRRWRRGSGPGPALASARPAASPAHEFSRGSACARGVLVQPGAPGRRERAAGDVSTRCRRAASRITSRSGGGTSPRAIASSVAPARRVLPRTS